MRGHGLGPGFTRIATRRSVIFKPEGLELVLTVFEKTSVPSPASTEPPSAIAEAFNISRRSNELPPFLFMARCPFRSGKFFMVDSPVRPPTVIISQNIRSEKIARLARVTALVLFVESRTFYVRRYVFMRTVLESYIRTMTAAVLGLCTAVLISPSSVHAQLLTFSKQELTDYTAQSTFERLPDGRPKVPEDLLERARELSSEEVWAVLEEKGFHNQYADGFQILHPEKPMVGRAFTVQFMPERPDVKGVASAKAKERGLGTLTNQTAIDMLQPADVLIVDLFGKKVNGTIVGDNLFYYVMKATHSGGLVVDGSIRDLNGISEIAMPAYFKAVDPTPT